MIIPNTDIGDVHLQQHKANRELIRPGQASYTYFKKYGRYYDWAGAGRASGRETAARVAGGAVAKLILDAMGIDVIAYITEIHGIKAAHVTYETAKANYRMNEINCPDPEAARKMTEELKKIPAAGDSCGGVVEIMARAVPAGLGEPVFDKLSAMIAHALLSIGGVKGIEFGDGFEHAKMTGSESNDTPYFDEESGRIRFRTNRAGGMLGGISNGEDIRVRVAVKPAYATILMSETADIAKRKHHPCFFQERPTICTGYIPFAVMMRMVLVDDIHGGRIQKRLICYRS